MDLDFHSPGVLDNVTFYIRPHTMQNLITLLKKIAKVCTYITFQLHERKDSHSVVLYVNNITSDKQWMRLFKQTALQYQEYFSCS